MFFGINSHWITTSPAGWQWMCPCCGNRYAAKTSHSEVRNGCYVFYREDTGDLMLSEWPATAEEDTIQSIVEATEPSITEEIARLGDEELQRQLTQFAARHAVPSVFQTLQLTEGIKSWVASENAKRTKQHPWNYDHLLDGFQGTKMEYRDDLPIMTVRDTKIFIAMCNTVLVRTAGV